MVTAVELVEGAQYLFEGQELPTLFTARILIEPPDKPFSVKGLVVTAGDTAVQLLPLSVEYS